MGKQQLRERDRVYARSESDYGTGVHSKLSDDVEFRIRLV
jgi:hypothetical protein